PRSAHLATPRAVYAVTWHAVPDEHGLALPFRGLFRQCGVNGHLRPSRYWIFSAGQTGQRKWPLLPTDVGALRVLPNQIEWSRAGLLTWKIWPRCVRILHGNPSHGPTGGSLLHQCTRNLRHKPIECPRFDRIDAGVQCISYQPEKRHRAILHLAAVGHVIRDDQDGCIRPRQEFGCRNALRLSAE